MGALSRRSCAAALLAAASACTLLTKWDPDGLPCHYDEAQKAFACEAGYSCADRANGGYACIADHSLSPGDRCWSDRQCADNWICPNNSCLQACAAEKAYENDSGCPSGSYCGPYVSAAAFSDQDPHTPALVAACAPSVDCDVGQTCALPDSASGNVCVAIAGGPRACLPSCQITWSANTYSDNCGISGQGSNVRQTCTAIGAENQQMLVCLQAAVGSRPSGQACVNAASTPCESGSTCFQGVCSKWCQATDIAGSTCPGGQTCCHRQINPTTVVGTCATSCP